VRPVLLFQILAVPSWLAVMMRFPFGLKKAV
jgi:hypothetical protein